MLVSWKRNAYLEAFLIRETALWMQFTKRHTLSGTISLNLTIPYTVLD
jgi:hypothetical protein